MYHESNFSFTIYPWYYVQMCSNFLCDDIAIFYRFLACGKFFDRNYRRLLWKSSIKYEKNINWKNKCQKLLQFHWQKWETLAQRIRDKFIGFLKSNQSRLKKSRLILGVGGILKKIDFRIYPREKNLLK